MVSDYVAVVLRGSEDASEVRATCLSSALVSIDVVRIHI